MLLTSRLRSLRRLVRNRHDCLEYLNSPHRSIALEVLRKGSLPCNIVVHQGTTNEEEQEFLCQLVHETSVERGPIVEIGTLFGFTTCVLALAKEPERKLITVDSFTWNPWGLSPAEHRRLTEQVLKVGKERLNVELVACDKDNFYRSYAGLPPSLVFIDAIHSYEEVKKDISWAASTGCSFIAGHDFTADFPGVIEAVLEVGQPEVYGTVWVLRRAICKSDKRD